MLAEDCDDVQIVITSHPIVDLMREQEPDAITNGVLDRTDKNISAKFGVQYPEWTDDDLAAMGKAFGEFGLGDEHFALGNQKIRDHAH